ncbi:hypothetical protein [Paraburkholderia diazotrophica]|uniref:hypothetical protein n=1 Tax=Paraburkholderia diazotrophica TaxID=667676 RepID=UPI00115F82D1|nr:hypothetical protein [Paraburkholderia diazotrophica]
MEKTARANSHYAVVLTGNNGSSPAQCGEMENCVSRLYDYEGGDAKARVSPYLRGAPFRTRQTLAQRVSTILLFILPLLAVYPDALRRCVAPMHAQTLAFAHNRFCKLFARARSIGVNNTRIAAQFAYESRYIRLISAILSMFIFEKEIPPF